MLTDTPRSRLLSELGRSALVVLCLASAALGCGGRDEHAGAGSQAPTAIPVCPEAKPLEPGQLPCLIAARSCGAGLCEDPRGPILIGCPGVTFAECESDGDCGPDELCVSDATPCAPPMKCVARCTDASCRSDEQCGSDGKCVPTPCEAGYVCPADWLCAPLRPQVLGQGYQRTDSHGCSPASCIDDGFACAANKHCSPSTGPDLHGCNSPRCDQGGSCPQDSRCQPSEVALGDGCAPLACTRDADCDCGACLMSQCAYQPGICVPQLQ